MDIPDWLSFFSFSWLSGQGFILWNEAVKWWLLKTYMSHTFIQATLYSEQVVSSSSMPHRIDKAFPVQPHDRGIHWFI